jgi:nicotinamidase-related amidase
MKKYIAPLAIVIILLVVKMSVVAEENNSLKGKYLIVLDVQEIATKKIMNEADAEKLIKAINSVIAISDSDKVIYIESIMAKLEISLAGLMVKFEDGLQLDERLMIVSDNKFVKNKANAFTSEKLAQFIENTKARDFVVVGLMAEHCVIETLFGGKEMGYKMYFIPGAIASESDEGKKATIEKAMNKGIEKIEISNLILNN